MDKATLKDWREGVGEAIKNAQQGRTFYFADLQGRFFAHAEEGRRVTVEILDITDLVDFINNTRKQLEGKSVNTVQRSKTRIHERGFVRLAATV